MKSKQLAVIALAAMSLTACSVSSPSAGPTPDKDPFTFVFVGGITGALASITSQEIVALDTAVASINKGGGILGHKVVMETLDSKSDPTEAVSVLQKRLASGAKPNLIRAGLGSNDALALVPVASREGIASYTSSSSPLLDDTKAYPLNKGISAPFVRQVEMSRTYMEFKKYKNITVLAPQDGAGDSTIKAVQAIYADSTIKVNFARYNATDVDLTVAYQRAVESKPDVLYVNCLGAPCIRVVQARGSAVNGTDIPMFGDISMAGSAGGPAASVPPAAVKNLHVLVWDDMLKKPATQQTSEFKVFYKGLSEDGAPTSTSAPGIAYDGLEMFAKAAAYAKSTDPAKMIKAINDMKWAPGDFVSYGQASLDYNKDSAFPTLPD
ncbi:MAG: branched-chain amino acid transporter substrate-binding protein, partial [Microbacteriaceae bacterium]|nr:branched-chain amino acid transporter substrate-binding protein [Microbacteriaceae bacterium]